MPTRAARQDVVRRSFQGLRDAAGSQAEPGVARARSAVLKGLLPALGSDDDEAVQPWLGDYVRILLEELDGFSGSQQTRVSREGDWTW